MITACFPTKPGVGITACTIQGHSQLAQAGEDVLCAAVSSAAYLVVNTITDVLHVTPCTLRVEDGDLYFELSSEDTEVCRVLLAGLKMHLQNLAEQYPEQLRVVELELS